MRNMLFITALATAALATTFAPPAEAGLDPKACERSAIQGTDCLAQCLAMRPGTGQLNCCDKCPGGPKPPVCGDGNCEKKKGENYKNCPADCQKPDSTTPVCGNGRCENGETPENCPADCKKDVPADCPRGQTKDDEGNCKPCLELDMMDINGECVNPCSTEGVLIFSCMSWCPSLNSGHGGFVRAEYFDKICDPCPNGDNGMRCLAEGEGKCPDCNGGGFDPTLLYVLIVMVGIGLILLVVLLAKKGKPTKCPKCGKMAVKNGVCRACWHEVTPTTPATPAPKPTAPTGTPPLPRPSGSGPSAPTTAP
jgi:hypothetical protein